MLGDVIVIFLTVASDTLIGITTSFVTSPYVWLTVTSLFPAVVKSTSLTFVLVSLLSISVFKSKVLPLLYTTLPTNPVKSRAVSVTI